MRLLKMRCVALGYRVVFMENNMCCQMIRNCHDSDWSDFGAGVGEGRGTDSVYKCTWSFYIGYHVANIMSENECF